MRGEFSAQFRHQIRGLDCVRLIAISRIKLRRQICNGTFQVLAQEYCRPFEFSRYGPGTCSYGNAGKAHLSHIRKSNRIAPKTQLPAIPATIAGVQHSFGPRFRRHSQMQMDPTLLEVLLFGLASRRLSKLLRRESQFHQKTDAFPLVETNTRSSRNPVRGDA